MLSKSLLIPRLASSKLFRNLHISSLKSSGHELEYWWGPEKNNGREVVGFGMSGDEVLFFKLRIYYAFAL